MTHVTDWWSQHCPGGVAESPTIYVELPYISNRIDENTARDAIVAMARRRADALSQFADIDLVKYSEYGDKGSHPEPAIRSLGGPARYEYVDGAGGPSTSEYELQSAFVVQIGSYPRK